MPIFPKFQALCNAYRKYYVLLKFKLENAQRVLRLSRTGVLAHLSKSNSRTF